MASGKFLGIFCQEIDQEHCQGIIEIDQTYVHKTIVTVKLKTKYSILYRFNSYCSCFLFVYFNFVIIELYLIKIISSKIFWYYIIE